MKTNMPSQIVISALAVAAAIAVPDGATAGEPMVLTNAQLDQVTAGKVEIHLVTSYHAPIQLVDELTPPPAEPVSIRVEPDKTGEIILGLRVGNPGTDTSPYWSGGFVIVDISDPAAR